MKLSTVTLTTMLTMVLTAGVASEAVANKDTQNRSDGIIHFKGDIVNAPCTINEKGTINVDLGKISSRTLEVGSKHSDNKSYVIKLENCDLNKTYKDKNTTIKLSKVNVSFYGQTDEHKSDLLKNTGSSKGLGIRLMNQDSSKIKLGEKNTDISLNAGTNKLTFHARVEANGQAVEAGSIEAQATYALTYL
ncbi:fimbrial protein [Providencia sneebia]|uniref:Fimbrial protein domain-containing protein n=1 Tax=Providencia sneebia DSM 19967 TaxID=1141660 RepID=K8WIG7_9GAMM|nr:fimbrial protein [Providencia sneebia]EKT60324.1 fimbrial protein domain-containing protein [Providencia sneebia DSM 19967]